MDFHRVGAYGFHGFDRRVFFKGLNDSYKAGFRARLLNGIGAAALLFIAGESVHAQFRLQGNSLQPG